MTAATVLFSEIGHYTNIMGDYECVGVGYNADTTKSYFGATSAAEFGFSDLASTAGAFTGKDYSGCTIDNISVDELNGAMYWYGINTEVPMYRLFYPGNHEHFYTSDANEKNVLSTQRGWTYEGIGWYAPLMSNTPVYRLFSESQGDHLYTVDENEVTYLIQNAGWSYEGIGWYSDDAEREPVYRQFSPYLTTGTHNYTTDENEKNVICASGAWNDEGIAWYAIRKGQ